MNLNNRFLREARELEARWPDSRLSNIGFHRASTAKMLECERLFNETGKHDCCKECKDKEAKEKAITFISTPE